MSRPRAEKTNETLRTQMGFKFSMPARKARDVAAAAAAATARPATYQQQSAPIRSGAQ